MGCLTLITVPIGNLGDITQRAREKLEATDFILAEDTRVLRSLLDHLDIEITGKSINSFYEHTSEKISWVLRELDQRDEICLVSDAGSPVISDPAFPLIKKAIEEGHQIQNCPGVSAVTAALELSGLPPLPFYFYGFLPREKGKQAQFFNELKAMTGTHIFFESPHRIKSSIANMIKYFPDAQFAVCRELTKKFETIYRFQSSSYNEEIIKEKGEFVVLVHLAKVAQTTSLSETEILELTHDYLNRKRTPKQLAKLIGKILSKPTSEIYEILNKK